MIVFMCLRVSLFGVFSCLVTTIMVPTASCRQNYDNLGDMTVAFDVVVDRLKLTCVWFRIV